MRSFIVIASLLTLFAPRAAQAAQCGSLTLDDQAQDVIIGEAGYEQCFPPDGVSCLDEDGCCRFVDYQVPTLGVCWTDAAGAEHMDIVNCTNLTPSSDSFSLSTQGGNDRVAVLKDAHTASDSSLLPILGGGHAVWCGAGGDALAPWDSSWAFTLSVSLGTGTDLFHGSENRDVAYSNAVLYYLGVFRSPADNSSDDQLCGWGGNDTLYGDEDDSYSANHEDRLDGGAGTDVCDGDWGIDGSDSSDLYRNCETHSDAFSDLSVGEINCALTDDPIHEW